jgi:hypothetical protein
MIYWIGRLQVADGKPARMTTAVMRDVGFGRLIRLFCNFGSRLLDVLSERRRGVE